MKKYTDVDIVAELQRLVDSHVDSYKEDFDIDKRIIRRAAESRNPEEKTLMWFCRPHGTHCLNENQVFIQGTRDHNTFRFYAEQTYDECIARVFVPKAVKRGKVLGDVFEINYREQAANVAQNAVAPGHDRLTFADGYVLDAPFRGSFDAAMALVGEHGGVKIHQTLPKDAEALAEVLSKQKTRRDRLPDAGRTETLSSLPVAELRKYEAVKKAHPDALVCFAQNGYFELYGKDAEKAAPLLGTKLLEKKVMIICSIRSSSNSLFSSPVTHVSGKAAYPIRAPISAPATAPFVSVSPPAAMIACNAVRKSVPKLSPTILRPAFVACIPSSRDHRDAACQDRAENLIERTPRSLEHIRYRSVLLPLRRWKYRATRHR